MCTEIVHRYGWSYGCSPFFHIQTTMHTVLNILYRIDSIITHFHTSNVQDLTYSDYSIVYLCTGYICTGPSIYTNLQSPTLKDVDKTLNIVLIVQ